MPNECLEQRFMKHRWPPAQTWRCPPTHAYKNSFPSQNIAMGYTVKEESKQVDFIQSGVTFQVITSELQLWFSLRIFYWNESPFQEAS